MRPDKSFDIMDTDPGTRYDTEMDQLIAEATAPIRERLDKFKEMERRAKDYVARMYGTFTPNLKSPREEMGHILAALD